MEFKVYDDLFSEKFLYTLHEICTYFPWVLANIANKNQYPYNCISSKGSHLFFGANLFHKNSFYEVVNTAPPQLFEVLEHFVFNVLQQNDLLLNNIQANLQVMGQDGTFHRDDYSGNGADRTILFYPHYKWDRDWGGELEILDGDKVVEKIFPFPGRIVFFDSLVKHRALAPTVPNLGRMSIAYRMEKTNAVI